MKSHILDLIKYIKDYLNKFESYMILSNKKFEDGIEPLEIIHIYLRNYQKNIRNLQIVVFINFIIMKMRVR